MSNKSKSKMKIGSLRWPERAALRAGRGREGSPLSAPSGGQSATATCARDANWARPARALDVLWRDEKAEGALWASLLWYWRLKNMAVYVILTSTVLPKGIFNKYFSSFVYVFCLCHLCGRIPHNPGRDYGVFILLFARAVPYLVVRVKITVYKLRLQQSSYCSIYC